jgi:hypothetical protein
VRAVRAGLESAWSNGKPAYRCRHVYNRAVLTSDPDTHTLRSGDSDMIAATTGQGD